jgi:aminoglycoside phosphotransferase
MVAGMFTSYSCFRFESVAAAVAALHRLHQLNILGCPLTVEYARGVAHDDSSLGQSEE